MLVFVATEVMFFTALISAFVIIRAGVEPWTPPVGVRLPVVATASNTVLLFLSAGFLHQAGRRFAIEGTTPWVRTLLGSAALLGVCFVVFQGFEWMRLIAYGMTITSGLFGACFFLLIGTHGLHAAAAAITMVYLYMRLTRNQLSPNHLRAMQVFWYFVVAIWPVLYGLVYF
jgi:heme/copper-type cytochrome/quinol oxidase subunit 3